VPIPVVVNLNGSPTWPNGSSQNMRVVAFAWFVILSCGTPRNTSQCSSNDGKQVNGQFVGLDTPNTGYTTGAWTGAGAGADACTGALTGYRLRLPLPRAGADHTRIRAYVSLKSGTEPADSTPARSYLFRP
jgi:hypothetical protein